MNIYYIGKTDTYQRYPVKQEKLKFQRSECGGLMKIFVALRRLAGRLASESSEILRLAIGWSGSA